ncbi:MAG: bifunctional phosphoglucose/phosphomannose isomerase [Dehalococcoidales bacterium]|nr:bifunctional phosphoglucose/phosphomannose isomerase [Dehalococcoidales bacterium]
MDTAILDDSLAFKKYDREDMLTRLKEMPSLCQLAWQVAINFELPPDYTNIDKVVILGMGGSAIGGDLVNSLVVTEAKIPIITCRDYQLPAFVDDRTLLIASSYSGNTEETLTAFEQALKTGAKKLAITTGGKLIAMAARRNIPVFHFDYQAQPRAALPFSLIPILCFLQKLNIISDKSQEIVKTVLTLENLSRRISESVPMDRNPAKQLSVRLYQHLPVIYGAGIASEVARRWKTQFNENGKAWSFYEVFPELNHNAIVGYQFPAELASKILVVLLRSAMLSERVQLRYQVTCQLLEQARVDYQIVNGDGESPLGQVMSLILFGDYVSYYLAVLYQVDPSPVKAIDFLKERLARDK